MSTRNQKTAPGDRYVTGGAERAANRTRGGQTEWIDIVPGVHWSLPGQIGPAAGLVAGVLVEQGLVTLDGVRDGIAAGSAESGDDE
jgi:hypothetical protein